MKHLFAIALSFVACTLYGDMPTRGLCAHQGDNACFPYNTVPGLVSAAQKGAVMVEFDVRRCKTGELVLMHDPTVDRTTNGTGKISELTFDEIRALDAGIKRGPKHAGTKVPTFDEAIDCLPRENFWINCHVGARDVALEVARKIKEKGRLHQAFLATAASYVDQLRAEVPGILICNMSRTGKHDPKTWNDEKHHQYAQTTVDKKCDFIQLLYLPPPADMKLMKDAGVKIALFSCNDPNKLKALLNAGVDFVLTDRLDIMKAKWQELENAAQPPAPAAGADVK